MISISVLIVYVIKENIIFIDAYPFSNSPSSYLDFAEIKILFVCNIHLIKQLEVNITPNDSSSTREI